MAAARTARPDSVILTAPWQPLGPSSVTSISYGNVTGRITAIALDPNDATGNTVYLGTTGGGVWKSTNAAGALSSVTFVPLTDDLPVFSANAGSSVIPAISIGALAVQPLANPVLLAGTGDPNDATDSLYGEGLLRSTDGGLTWAVVQGSHDGANGNHSFIGLGTAGIAFSTATPTLVVAAFSTSADGVLTGASNTATAGLYYSTDAGQTWQMASVYDGAQVVQQPTPYMGSQPGNAATSVVWDAQRAVFVAAVRYHGYYSSADGVTWTRLASQPGTGLSAAHCPSITTSTACPIFRGTLAVQPLTGDLYALTVDAIAGDQGLWQDLCRLTSGVCSTPAPTFPTRVDNGALDGDSNNTAIAQGTYNLTLAAAPATSGETELYAGTIDLYRCTLASNSSACIWRNTTNAVNGCAAPAKVAPAQHALATLSQTSGAPLLFLGNDSGLWRSLDGVAETGAACSATDASHFDNLNAAIGVGGSLAEIVGLAQSPSDANTLLAGMGQNGSDATSAASGLAAWPQLSAGEGGYPLLDPNSPMNWLLAIGAEVNFSLCALGGSCTASDFVPPANVGGSQVSNDAAQLDAPASLDPGRSTNLVTATCRVWRGPASGNAWSTSNALSPAFDGGATPCTGSSALVRSIAVGGPVVSSGSAQWGGSTVMYAGMSGTLDGGATIAGHVFVTTAANTASSSSAWTDLKGSPVTNDSSGFNPAGFDISALAVDPHDMTGATVYATVMGFGQPHVYQSTDFGAHWTNLSANLPDAPANAVAVDPSDANTVYVALDTGIYVTTAVTTCATTNCWSPLGIGLPNSPVTSLVAGASLPTGDGRVGLLRAGTYGRGIWSTPLLTAAAPLAAAITVSPLSLTFPATGVDLNSAVQIVTVTSSGNTALTIGALTISGNFAITADTCSEVTVAAGTSCTVGVVFAPVVLGAAAGTLSIPSSASSGTVGVALSGTGVHPPTDALAPISLAFASQQTGTTSAVQSITLTNSGDLPLSITGITSLNAQFTESDTCGSSLAAQSSCNISVTFAPTASGTISSSLTMTDALRTQTVRLGGTAFNAATDTLSPTSLTFASQALNTTSVAQTVTLTNSGDVALSLTSISSTSVEFVQTNSCGSSVAAHSACAVSVTFTPTVSGTRTGSIIVADALQTETVTLSGGGYLPATDTLAPLALTFASQPVNATSTPQSVTLTNTGDVALSITSVAASPAIFALNNPCGSSLAAHSSCTLGITFTPTASGAVSGSFVVTDTIRAQTISLSGTGYLPATDSLSTNSINFGTQQVSTASSPRDVTLTNSGDLPLAIASISSTSAEFVQTNSCGNSVAAHSSCTVSVTFTPAVSGTRTGSLIVADALQTETVTLSGGGYVPATDTIAPLALTFASQPVNTTSTPQSVTLTNTGDVALSITSVAASPAVFALNNPCGSSLAAHSSCTLSIAFTPTASGAVSGSLVVTDTIRAQTLSLSGTGYLPATDTFSANSINFGTQLVSTPSASRNVTLTNSGDVALSLTGISSTSAEFVQTNNCGGSVAAHSACTIAVSFVPATPGNRTGSINVADANGAQAIALTGLGVAAPGVTLTPMNIGFAAVLSGATSGSQTVTMTNNGGSVLTLSSAVASSNFGIASSTCASTLAVGASCTYNLTFTPPASGPYSGSFTLTDNAPTSPQVVVLTGTGATPAALLISPASLTFPSTTTEGSSTGQVVVLSNTGGLPLTLSGISASSEFAISSDTCGGTLSAAASCTVGIEFAPTTTGLVNGSLTISNSAMPSTQAVALSGMGLAPATDTLAPLSLSFSSQPTGVTSAAQGVTLTNSGDSALTLTAVSTSNASFAVTNGCGASLAAHSACTLNVIFSSATSGISTGTLSVSDTGRTQTISLSGTTYDPATDTLSAMMLSFGSQIIGSTGSSQAVTLSNTGQVALNITSVTTSTAEFGATGNCGSSLAAHSSCTINVTFTPTSSGLRSGSMTIVDAIHTQTVSLSGTSYLAATDTLSAASLTFASQQVSITSAAQTVTLSNSGDVALTLTGVSSSNPSFVVTNSCGASLAAHSACTLSVAFSSATSGTSTGTLSVSDTSRTQTVSLSGTTYDPATDTLSAMTLSFGSQAVGSTSSSQPVTLSNTGQVALNITSITTSSAEFGATGNCGSSLAAHSSCTINVTFTPTSSGLRSGSMTIVDAAHTQAVSLSGTGYVAATDTLSAGSLSFASQQVSTTSAAQSVTLSNSGDVALAITSVSPSSPEFAMTTSCGAALAAHSSCTLGITFTPSATGTRSGTITLIDSAHTESITLSGTGVAAANLVLTPTSLLFPATIVNQASATQVITLSNIGGVAATLQTPTISGDFAIANNTCGGQLAPGTGCSVAITFTPTGSGLRSGTLSVGSSVGTQTAALSGIGNAPATDTLTPLALTFAMQAIGSTSAGQQVTLTNSGDVALTLISASTSTVEFGAVNACGTSLAAHSTCAVVVTFTPTATGTRTGLLTINDAFRSQTVVLNGTAIAPQGVSLSPASLSFAPTGVGLTSSAQALVLTNNGGLPLTVASVGISSGFALTANGCGALLAAGASCTIQIVSTPGAAGPYTGALTMVTDATPSTRTVALTGTGVDFALIVTGPSSQTVSSGAIATYTLQLSSPSSLSGAVALSCAGAPVDSHCIVTPSAGALGGAQGLTVTVTTGVAALAPGPAVPWMRGGAPVLFAIAVPLLWMRRHRRNVAGLTLVVLLSLVAGITGCGAGRALPPGATTTDPDPTPTPKGTYTLTVTGMASGVSRAVQLTLIVQ